MDIIPPFGYRDVKALNRDDYVRYSSPSDMPPFIKDTAIVPLSLGEMVAAAWHYPLVFVRDAANDRVTLVAMLGLAAGENLFTTPMGWKADTYLPAYVRRYPFCMTRVTVNGAPDPNLLVCVEKDYVAPDAIAGSRRLFDQEGKATGEWQQIELFLREYETDLYRTNAFCTELLEGNLLEPLTATVSRPGQDNWQVTGFMGINEKKLMELPDETIAEWHRNGWLARAWLHLFSLQRLQRLLQDRGTAPFPGRERDLTMA
jgi:hypothetical protein